MSKRRAGLSVLAGFVLLAYAATIAANVQAFNAGHDTAHVETTRGLQNLALSLERAMGREIGDLDRALTSFSDAREADRADPDRAAAVLTDAGLMASGLSRELGPFQLIDASGNGAVAPSSATPESYADAPFFRWLAKSPGRDIAVGFSTGVPPTFAPGLIVAKRLSNADGSFAGAVAGLVRQDRLNEMLSSYDLGPNGTASILSGEGVVVASFPANSTPLYRDDSESPAFQHLLQTGPGVFDAPGATSGQLRAYVARKLPGLPVYILISTPTEGVYAMSGALSEALIVAATGLVIGVGAFAFGRRFGFARRSPVEADMLVADAGAVGDGQLQVYFNSFSLGLLVLRHDGQTGFVFERANAEARRLLSLPDDVAGKAPEAVWDSKRWFEVGQQLDLCLQGDAPVRRDLTASLNGIVRTLRLVVTAVPGSREDGGVLLLARVEDITGQEQAEAESRRQHHLDGVERLTSGIANEFNNLLQIITGHLELVREDQEGHAKAAMEAATRGARLTSGLLSFTSRQVLRPESVAPEVLFESIRGSFESPSSLGSTLVTEVAPGTHPAFADQNQLRLALLNLCANGHEAMLPGGGTITLRAFEAESQTIGDAPAQYVVFTVSDTGPGMTDEVAKQAKEPFFTTKGARLRLGMGLPMADGFCRQSGGELRLHSSKGQGTTAELWLPSAEAAADPVPWQTGPEPRVLLVEDMPDLLALFGDVLLQGGFQVTKAAGPEQALVYLRSAVKYDLLITDYVMAGLNGAELIELARGIQPHARALIVTGDADEAQLATLTDRVGVLRKPFRADQLLRHARELTAEAEFTSV